MPVPLSIHQLIRVMVWQWAVEGYGWEDIDVKLRRQGYVVDKSWIIAMVKRAQEQKR